MLAETNNYLELNDKNTAYKYLWDVAKVILRGNLQLCIKFQGKK